MTNHWLIVLKKKCKKNKFGYIYFAKSACKGALTEEKQKLAVNKQKYTMYDQKKA